MTPRKTPKGTAIIPFAAGAALDGEEELVIGLPPASTAEARSAPAASAVDLSGRAKAWFATGPGRRGKTTLLRYLAKVILEERHEAVFAALDPQNRSLWIVIRLALVRGSGCAARTRCGVRCAAMLPWSSGSVPTIRYGRSGAS